MVRPMSTTASMINIKFAIFPMYSINREVTRLQKGQCLVPMRNEMNGLSIRTTFKGFNNLFDTISMGIEKNEFGGEIDPSQFERVRRGGKRKTR